MGRSVRRVGRLRLAAWIRVRQRAKLREAILGLLSLQRWQCGVGRGLLRLLLLLLGRLLARCRYVTKGSQTWLLRRLLLRLLRLLLLGCSRSLLLVLTRVLWGKVLRCALCVRVVAGIEGVAIHDDGQRMEGRWGRSNAGVVLALDPCSSKCAQLTSLRACRVVWTGRCRCRWQMKGGLHGSTVHVMRTWQSSPADALS